MDDRRPAGGGPIPSDGVGAARATVGPGEPEDAPWPEVGFHPVEPVGEVGIGPDVLDAKQLPGPRRRSRVDDPDDDPVVRSCPGSLDDDSGVLAATDDHEWAGRHRSTGIGALRGGLGGRHAAMISAIRAPARPSANDGMSGDHARPEGRIERGAKRDRDVRGVRRRIDDVRLAPPAVLAIPNVDRRQIDRGRLDETARAVAEHRVGDP